MYLAVLVDRRPAKHRQRATRPHSPYSTDSNYSGAASRPRRPYPKSERRRQLMESGGDSTGDRQGNNSPRTPDRLRTSNTGTGNQFTHGNISLRLGCSL